MVRKSSKRRPSDRRRPLPPQEMVICEVDVAEGLEIVALGEIRYVLKRNVGTSTDQLIQRPGALQFPYMGNLRALLGLRTVNAAYQVFFFPIPRPRALLGDQNFRRLSDSILHILKQFPEHRFKTLYVRAAGRDSSVMKRLEANLAQVTGLSPGRNDGDLLIRIRKPLQGGNGWEVLVRLGPRPLSTRPWRVCDYPGALNASVAHAMILLTDPQPRETFLNLACGSGTLMIERLAWGSVGQVLGCDISPIALSCARRNLDASAHNKRDWELILCDGTALALADQSIDVICADLPFGSLVGSHQTNLTLYPAVLHAAARITRPAGVFALVTHEVQLIESLLGQQTDWLLRTQQRINLRGLHPRIYILQKS